jgi:hypothetical protein
MLNQKQGLNTVRAERNYCEGTNPGRSARSRYISPTSGAISRIVKCLLIRKRISEPQS